MGQLQDVDEPDHDRAVVHFAGPTVVEGGLAVQLDQPFTVDRLGPEVAEDLLDGRVATGTILLVPLGAVEDGRRHVDRGLGGRSGLLLDAADGLHADGLAVYLPAPTGAVPEMGLEHLPDVHTGRDAQRVQDDVDRGAIGQVGHVLDREDL